MEAISTKLDMMRNFDESIKDDKDFLLSAIEGEFKTFEKNVLASYPDFFVEGKLLKRAERDVKYREIEASLKDKPEEAKFNWETLDRVLTTYSFCASFVPRLPKTEDDLAQAKQAFAEYQESLRVEEKFFTEGQTLFSKLQPNDALVTDKALEQDVTDFLAKVRAAFPQGPSQQLHQACQTIKQRLAQLKQGGGQPGPINPQPVNWATWKSCSKHKNKKADCQQAKCTEWSTKTNGSRGNNAVKKGTCSKKGPGAKLHTKAECKGKGHDSKAWKATTAEKKGMAWYWWVVIIGGILAVLGTVAYLFLGSDASNDEEWSPEEAEA